MYVCVYVYMYICKYVTSFVFSLRVLWVVAENIPCCGICSGVEEAFRII